MARDIQHFTEMESTKRQHFTEVMQVNQKSFAEAERAYHHSSLLELENRILQMERRLPPASNQAE